MKNRLPIMIPTIHDNKNIPPRIELVFIDDSLADLPQLLLAVGDEHPVHLFDAGRDGLSQIAQSLAGHAEHGRIDAIHVLSHGRPGVLYLGALVLDTDMVQLREADLAAIGAALRQDGDILLYGCEAGAGAAGRDWLDRMSAATGCRLAASDHVVGNALLGGDWALPVMSGAVEARVAVPAARAGLYPHILVGTAAVITGLDADSVPWGGTNGAVTLDRGGDAAVSDQVLDGGGGQWNGASLVVARASGASVSDAFGFDTVDTNASSNAGFTVSGNALQSNSSTFATFTNAGGTLTIQFANGGTDATNALVQDVLRHITYSNGAPSGNVTIQFALDDGVSGQPPATANVTVATDPINVDTVADTTTVNVNDGISMSEAVALAGQSGTNHTLILTSAFGNTTVQLADNLVIAANLTLDASAGGGGALGYNKSIALNGATLTFQSSGNYTLGSVLSGTGSLTKTGSGTLTLTGGDPNNPGVNTYSGATTISAGQLTISGGQAIGDTSAVTVASGATLRSALGSETIGSLAGAGTVVLVSNGLKVGGDNNALTSTDFSGVISGIGNGLTKLGAGTQTLSGANTYTGSTTVSAGTLKISNSTAISNSSGVSVAAGATLEVAASTTIKSLSGAGTVTLDGANTLALASGSSLTGGTLSTADHLTLNGNLALVANNTLSAQLGSAGYDQISVNGTVNLTGATLNISLIGPYAPAAGTSFTLIANDSTDAVTGTFTGLGEGATLAVNGKYFTISYVGGTGNDVVLTAIVPPDTTPPAFVSGAVNGSTLVMTYDEALNAVHVPASGNFSVMAGGSPDAVTAMAINSVNKTVTLTLATAVTNGQAVTVTYTDPTVGDDTNAIQDAAGNDAVTLTAQPVTNNTAAAAPPPPPSNPAVTVDGVPVTTTTTTLPGGGSGSTVSIPIVAAGEGTAIGNPNAADIPLSTSGGATILLAQVPVGTGLTATSGASQPAGTSLDQLTAIIKASTATHDIADQNHLIVNGQQFLNLLASNVPLLINAVTVQNTAAATLPLTLTGTSTDTQHTALVIDASQMSSGSSIVLNTVDFAAVVGAVTITGSTAGQILTGDLASQHFIVSNTGASQIYAGGGNDILQFGVTGNTATATATATANAAHASALSAPTKILLNGGTGTDTALFTKTQSAYTIDQHDGYILVTDKADASQQITVTNVENLQFSDGAIAVQSRAELTTIAGLYQSILGRQADVGGFNYWGAAQNGGASLGAVSVAMLNAPESAARGFTFNDNATHDVTTLYNALFNRAPDAGGLAYWVNALQQGHALADVANGFVHALEITSHQVAAVNWDLVF